MSHSTTINVVDLRGIDPMVTLNWLYDITENLRPEDLDEIEATSGDDPLIALIASVMDSELGFVVLHGEEPVAVFGAAPVIGLERESGQVWMVGTPAMDKPAVALAILRQTKAYIDVLQARFPCLWNWIDARNDKSMRWLTWAGFTVIGLNPHHGREGRLFLHFARQEAPLSV